MREVQTLRPAGAGAELLWPCHSRFVRGMLLRLSFAPQGLLSPLESF